MMGIDITTPASTETDYPTATSDDLSETVHLVSKRNRIALTSAYFGHCCSSLFYHQSAPQHPHAAGEFERAGLLRQQFYQRGFEGG